MCSKEGVKKKNEFGRTGGPQVLNAFFNGIDKKIKLQKKKCGASIIVCYGAHGRQTYQAEECFESLAHKSVGAEESGEESAAGEYLG